MYRIDKLEQKQDKYNHLQERVFNLEKKSAAADEEIKVANHRIADLEQK
nr:MAG TPA: hemolysin [Caudoviricetes sp.]